MRSSLQSIREMYASKRSMSAIVIFLDVKSLKNMLNSVSACQTLLGSKSWKAIGIRLCMKTWQSWLFIPNIFNLFISTHRAIFKAYPSGNLILSPNYTMFVYFLCPMCNMPLETFWLFHSDATKVYNTIISIPHVTSMCLLFFLKYSSQYWKCYQKNYSQHA